MSHAGFALHKIGVLSHLNMLGKRTALFQISYNIRDRFIFRLQFIAFYPPNGVRRFARHRRTMPNVRKDRKKISQRSAGLVPAVLEGEGRGGQCLRPGGGPPPAREAALAGAVREQARRVAAPKGSPAGVPQVYVFRICAKLVVATAGAQPVHIINENRKGRVAFRRIPRPDSFIFCPGFGAAYDNVVLALLSFKTPPASTPIPLFIWKARRAAGEPLGCGGGAAAAGGGDPRMGAPRTRRRARENVTRIPRIRQSFM